MCILDEGDLTTYEVRYTRISVFSNDAYVRRVTVKKNQKNLKNFKVRIAVRLNRYYRLQATPCTGTYCH